MLETCRTERMFEVRAEPAASDVPKIKRLVEATGVFTAAEVAVAIELLEDRIQKGALSEYHFLIAHKGDEVLGYICYGHIAVTRARADIYWIAVDKSSQSRGIGSQLLEVAERHMAGIGMRAVFIETSSRREYLKTRFFYLKNGYEIVAQVPGYYDDHDDMLVFRKVFPA